MFIYLTFFSVGFSYYFKCDSYWIIKPKVKTVFYSFLSIVLDQGLILYQALNQLNLIISLWATSHCYHHYRLRNWGTEMLSELPKFTQQVSIVPESKTYLLMAYQDTICSDSLKWSFLKNRWKLPLKKYEWHDSHPLKPQIQDHFDRIVCVITVSGFLMIW